MSRLTCLTFVLLAVGCASQRGSQNSFVFDSNSNFELLESGLQELPRNAKRAKEQFFDPVIANCESAFENSETRAYYARTPAESLFYMMMSAADKQAASVVQVPCSEALYLAGYASLDLGDLPSAESYLRRALEWSPVNPQYRSELAHLMQVQRKWEQALDMFVEAEDNTSAFSPEEIREAELARAKRGIGFALIELGRLEEAEVKFKECLEINPNDEKAQHELTYISELRAQSGD